VSSMLEKLPGMGMAQLPPAAQSQLGDGLFKQMGVIIDSMTRHERRYPDLINGSRKRRIASGSGTQIQDVNRLLKQHKQMQKMMKKVTKKGGMAKMMRQVASLKGAANRGPRG
jgi:signal recognition particle subunit SRP54